MVYEFAARLSAAGILLDRGWGRAPQPQGGEDGKDIRVWSSTAMRIDIDLPFNG